MTEIQKTQFRDIQGRVAFIHRFVDMVNSRAEAMNLPREDAEPRIRAARKQHAKFYGLDNKYDGKGNKRNPAYQSLPKSSQYQFGRKMSMQEAMTGVAP